MNSNIYIRKLSFLLISLCFMQLIVPLPAGSSDPVKVGVYQNAPLTLVEGNGNTKGFFIDILEHIASTKGWEIEYVHSPLPECLRNLENGNIDLLGGIAYSKTRGRNFDYTYESVITNWGQIYLNKKSDIKSIIDLKGKKVAVLQNDIYFNNLRKLVHQSGIKCRFIEAFEYEDVLELVDIGRCEAGLVSQVYGLQHERDYDIIKSPILLSPQKLYWATPKGKNQELLYTLDSYLRKLKDNHQSIYYEALAKWFGIGEKSKFGKWFKWVISSFAVLFILFFTMSLILRVQVKSKTNELLIKNEALKKEIKYRKQAEEALRESGATISSIFRAAPTGIGMVCDRVVKQANERLCEMLGYSQKELLGKNARILYPTDEDYEYVGREKYSQISEKGTGTVETPLQCKDGNVIDVLLSSTPIDANDLSIGVTFTALDITERKRSEEALQKSEGRLRQVIDLVPHFIFAKDRKGRYILVNQAVAEAYGTSVEELIGKTDADFNPNKDEVEHFLRDDLQVIDSGRPKDIPEEKLTDSKGNIRIVHTTKIPFTLSMTKDDAVLGVSIDITKNKQAEEERRNMEAQLQQAHKMESIGTLAGGIAHDFNNILEIIIGNTELALDDVQEWNTAKLNLKEIRIASLRAKDVVHQLLSFARKTRLEKKPTNIVPIVKESLKLLRSSIPTNIEIRKNIPTDVDTILADPTQINQVLINLCTNAGHAMTDGGIIEVILKNVEFGETATAQYPDLNPGRYVNLTVSDTGHGVSKEEIDRVFDPYFTTKEVGKGTGMGLAVVHGIVKEHNGMITLESKPGKGTTFSIFFPAVEKDAVIESEPTEKLPTGNEKILFIDDEPSIVNMARQMLERLGYEVDTKMSSIEALELFRSNPNQFDLIITDMTMPLMTGDKLVIEILNIRPDIPIILCTGFSEKIDEKKAKAIGAADYIEKPLHKHDFAFRVRKVLDRK